MQVGKDVEEVYWRPGNGAAFLDLVQQLTGEALTADAWVSKLKESVTSVVRQEEKDYQEAEQQGPQVKPGESYSSPHCQTVLIFVIAQRSVWVVVPDMWM